MRALFKLVLLSLCAVATHAQTLGVSVGSNQLLDSSGTSLTLYEPHSTEMLSIGIADSHIVVGSSAAFDFYGGQLKFGDDYFSSGGVTVPIRGVSFKQESRDHKVKYILFTGAASDAFTAPYLFAFDKSNRFGVGGYFEQDLTPHLQVTSLEVIAGKQKTALETVRWQSDKLQLFGGAGFLQNAKQVYGSGSYHPIKWLLLSAGRSLQFYLGQQSATNNVGGNLLFGHADFYSNFYDGVNGGVRGSGEMVGASFQFWKLSTATNYFESSHGSRVTSQITEHFTRHWSVSQYVSHDGQWSMNWGGEYDSNRISASLGYATIFLPLPNRTPFQQSLAVTIRLQLPRSVTVDVSTFMTPDGRVRLGADGTTYAAVGPQAVTSAPAVTQHVSGGKYILSGTCLDASNSPIAGCAVKIDGLGWVFSDSRGIFEVHTRHRKPESLIVDPDQFVAPGEWRVLDAPQVIEPGQPVIIRVTRF